MRCLYIQEIFDDDDEGARARGRFAIKSATPREDPSTLELQKLTVQKELELEKIQLEKLKVECVSVSEGAA